MRLYVEGRCDERALRCVKKQGKGSDQHVCFLTFLQLSIKYDEPLEKLAFLVNKESATVQKLLQHYIRRRYYRRARKVLVEIYACHVLFQRELLQQISLSEASVTSLLSSSQPTRASLLR